MHHPAFDIKNPNKVSALIIQFSRNNPYYFHRIDGKGYAFLQDIILQLDKLNPQVASRVAQVFTNYKRYDDKRRALIKNTLQSMQKMQLSKDLYEIVNKSLTE
jgi:aminopeptidase N